jgi:hypothetical protein
VIARLSDVVGIDKTLAMGEEVTLLEQALQEIDFRCRKMRVIGLATGGLPKLASLIQILERVAARSRLTRTLGVERFGETLKCRYDPLQ